MAAVQVVRFAASTSVPWSNGGGSTRVLVDDGDERGGLWSFRISVAELTGAQPFSSFPGVDRHLTFLGPGTLFIRVNGAPSTLRPREDIRFDGADAVDSEPSISPARDLNVMVRRDVCTARVVQTDGVSTVTPSGSTALWISLQEGGRVRQLRLGELDVARLPLGTPVEVSGRGVLVDILS